jgi:hypothetical protein
MADGLPCEGWVPATATCTNWASYSQAVRDYATDLATLVLWAATGRRYGRCLITVRPCGPTDPVLYRTYPVQDGNYWTLYGAPSGGVIGPVTTSGCCGGTCVCSPSEIILPGPVAEVVEVQIDGVVVNTDGYRLDGERLVRIGAEPWPTSQDLSAAAGAENTWTIQYRRGRAVPTALQNAAGLFACEVAKARSGGSCALPARITSVSRQGVDVQLLQVEDFLEKGLTGYEQVDMVIRALNPGGLHAAPRVLSLDLPQMR